MEACRIGEPVEIESELHDDILRYCANKLWYVVHSRMDKETTTQKGVPDFIIFGRRDGEGMPTVWLIEAKSKSGKLKPEQAATKAYLDRNGFTVRVVRSMPEFMAVVT